MKTRRVFSLMLALFLIFSAVIMPVHATGYTTVYNKLMNYAKSGSYYGGDWDYLEGEHFYHVTYEIPITEYGWLEDNVFEVTYSDLNSLELRLGSNERWTWVIVPRNPGQPWEIKTMDRPVYRGSALIDPATYTPGTELTVHSFTGDESKQQEMLNGIKLWFPAILDFTSQVLADLGCQLTDLGFAQFPNNESHYWYLYYGSADCVNGGEGDFVCRYCNAMTHMTLPAGGEHSWNSGIVVRQPTCTTPGSIRFTCSRCDAKYTEELPALGHAWDEGCIVEEPGCATEGVKRCTCTRCAASQDFPIPALGHLWTFTEVLTEAGEGLHACTGLYTCTRCNETKEARLCAAEVFTDMPKESNWAHDPIDWAYFNGITAGKTPTTFKPKDVVTRGEAMTFLWKTIGAPEPNTEENPFKDVKSGKYYYKPVLWAVENDVTGGTSDTTFSPKQKCTRAQIMMFIWAAAGRPEPTAEENPFTDVKENKYYYKAVLWAVENGITDGVAEGRFGPNQTCTRAQIVTFLYKAEALLNADPKPETGFIAWNWISGDELLPATDYSVSDWMLEQGFARFLAVTVRGEVIPSISTDNPDILFIKQEESLPDSENGDKTYVWTIIPTGKGIAHIFCEVEGQIAASLTAAIGDNP